MNALTCCAVLIISVFANFIAKNSNDLALEVESSIARLNYAGFSKLSHCSASLVTPNAALTAKHCIQPELHLLFGYDKGEWVEHRKVLNSIQHPIKDIAILCFKVKSDQRPLKLLRHQESSHASPGKQISVYGYPRSRSHLLLRKQCGMGKLGKKGVLNCPLERGMSGGPVLHAKDNSIALLGVASTTTATSSQIELVDSWVIKNVDACLPKNE